MKTNDLLFESVADTKPGVISRSCHFVADGDIRMIFHFDTQLYTYDIKDRAVERLVWVMIYEMGLAQYKQIARSIGKGERTIQLWVSEYRSNGAGALNDAPKSGAPRKVTSAMRKRILRLREQRLKLHEIAKACQISVSSVKNVLSEQKKDFEARQLALELERQDAKVVDIEEDVKEVEIDAKPENVASEAESVAQEYDEEVEDALSKDRTEDRLAAASGQLQDAQPLFGHCEHAEWAGAFMAVVLLSQDACLQTGEKVFERFPAAFYGLRTMLVTWVLMTLLRIKCTEAIRKTDARRLGRILGLDRAPEVKTICRKLHSLIDQKHAMEWMEELAKARVGEYDGPVKTIQIDGHVVAYSGKQKLGTVYSSRTKQITKAQTENYVNLPDYGGLFLVTSPFNEGLTGVIEDVVEQACKLTGERSLFLVFDRGGYSTSVFDRLIKAGHHIITYRKGSFDDIDLSLFEERETIIGERRYKYAPYERDIKLDIYEKMTTQNGATIQKKTKRKLALREIRIVREDGRQTAILTSTPKEDTAALEVATRLFARTGDQENSFKYMREEFAMDAKSVYELDAIIDEELTHPNPEYTKLEKKKKKIVKARDKLLARYAKGLVDIDIHDALMAVRKLKAKGMVKQAAKIAGKIREIEEINQLLEVTPMRGKIFKADYKMLNEQARVFQFCIKMSAYHIEQKLVDMLSEHYANMGKEGRKLIAAALQTTGSIRLEPGKLVIQLEPQSSPSRTRAINQVLDQLNQLNAKFPGSSRVIFFELSPEPIPVLHAI